jgi:hypothetical protein
MRKEERVLRSFSIVLVSNGQRPVSKMGGGKQPDDHFAEVTQPVNIDDRFSRGLVSSPQLGCFQHLCLTPPDTEETHLRYLITDWRKTLGCKMGKKPHGLRFAHVISQVSDVFQRH